MFSQKSFHKRQFVSSALAIAASVAAVAGFVYGATTIGTNISVDGNLTVSGTSATSTFSTGGFTVGTNQFVVQQTSGNVGIGTTNPLVALHIISSSNSFTGGQLTNTMVGSSAAARWVVSGDTANTAFETLSSGYSGSGLREANDGVILNTGSGTLNIGQGTTANNSAIRFFTNGTAATNERMRIDASGNVGVGTTTPYSLLSLSNNLNTLVDTPLFTIASTTGGTATSTLMTVLANGKVGIGTTALIDVLTVAANNDNNLHRIDFQNTNAGTLSRAGIIFRSDVAVAGIDVRSSGNTASLGAPGLTPANSVDLYANTSNVFLIRASAAPIVFAPSNTERVRFDTNGNVGIGTTTPYSKFHVTSGASATTTVNFGEVGSATSKACFNTKNVSGADISFYFNAANALVVESNLCR